MRYNPRSIRPSLHRKTDPSVPKPSREALRRQGFQAMRHRTKLPEPIILKQGPTSLRRVETVRDLAPIKVPKNEPTPDYPFRREFAMARTALLSSCPDNGFCLIKLENRAPSKVRAKWIEALQKLVAFLCELGHIVIDELTRRARRVNRHPGVSRRFYDEVISQFVPVAAV